MRPIGLLCVGLCLMWPLEGVSGQAVQWHVDSIFELSVGDGEGPGHDLLFVRDAAVLGDGSVIVLGAGTKDIRQFTADGSFIRTVGREGEGPGEFQSPGGFQVLESGEVLVYDRGSLRLTRFDRDWEVLSTQRVAAGVEPTGPTPASGRRRPLLNGLVPMPSYDVPFMESVRRPGGIHEDELVIRVLDGQEVRGSIRRPRGAVFQVRDGNQGLTLPLPMGESALYTWNGVAIVVGWSHSTTFDIYDVDGVRTGVALAEGSPRPATRADMRAFDAQFREERLGARLSIRGMSINSDRKVESFLSDAPRGDRVPLFDKVQLDELGRVWAREYVLGSDSATWQIVDVSAGVIARVVLPAAWEILRATDKYVLVLEKDDYDVELVRKYRIGR